MRGYEELPNPLSAEKEEELLYLCKKGDENSRKLLIEHNLRLVFYVANKYKSAKTASEDITSIGTIGLIKAIDTFDPTKNIKLATYASKCIENEILMHFRRDKKTNNDVSLQNSINTDKDGNELSLADTIGTNRDKIEVEIEKKHDIRILKDLIMDLPDEEQRIICYRYGIDCEKKRQSDIAKIFDISQSYISRIERKILYKLKKEFENVVS